MSPETTVTVSAETRRIGFKLKGHAIRNGIWMYPYFADPIAEIHGALFIAGDLGPSGEINFYRRVGHTMIQGG